TATATNNLQVVGAVAIGTSAFNVSAPTTGLLVEGNVGIGTTTNNIGLSVSSSSGQAGMSIKSNGVQGIYQNSSGYVGIGTTTLTYSTSAYNNSKLTVSDSTGDVGITVEDTSDSIVGQIMAGTSGFWVQSLTSSDIKFVTNNGATPQMILKASGNVGIGTTVPAGKLQVVGGDVLVGTGSFGNGGSSDDLYVTGNIEFDGLIYGNGSQLTNLSAGGWTDGGTTVYNTTLSDKVGIGTSAPLNNLQVVSTVGIGTTEYNVAAPSNGMIVQGNVGIGTSGVTNKLDVNGAIAVGTYASSAVRTAPTSGMAISGNVGIGTATATNNLQVVGAVAIGTSAFNVSAPTTGLLVEGNVGLGTTTNNVGLSVSSDSGQAALNVKSNGVQGLFQDKSGNVGIATTAPSALLSVMSTTSNVSIDNPKNGAGLILRGNDTGVYGQLRIIANNGAWADSQLTAYFQSQTGSNNNLSFMGGTYGNDVSLDRLQFNSLGTTITDITFSKTPAPTAVLEVIGSVSTTKVELAVRPFLNQTANMQQWLNNSGSAVSVVTASGNLGIGTTGTTNALQVDGTVSFRTTGGAQGLSQDTSGNVGIGSTNPGTTLYLGSGTISYGGCQAGRGHATCLTTDNPPKLGYCTSQPNASGICTCTACP
ncbi:MAG: hypothetical protein HQL24_04275, partial [Candidatus Omnitrophica bacterium]|nr:hypothetical protein [Candidatus Omnitrophota bacterium]